MTVYLLFAEKLLHEYIVDSRSMSIRKIPSALSGAVFIQTQLFLHLIIGSL